MFSLIYWPYHRMRWCVSTDPSVDVEKNEALSTMHVNTYKGYYLEKPSRSNTRNQNWAMIMPENILEVKWIQGKQQMSWKAWWYQIMQKNAYCWFSLSPKCVSFHHEYWWTTVELTWQFTHVLVLQVTFKNQFQWNTIVGIYLTIQTISFFF